MGDCGALGDRALPVVALGGGALGERALPARVYATRRTG